VKWKVATFTIQSFTLTKTAKPTKKLFEYKVFGTRPEGNGKAKKEKFLGQISFDLGNYMNELGELV